MSISRMVAAQFNTAAAMGTPPTERCWGCGKDVAMAAGYRRRFPVHYLGDAADAVSCKGSGSWIGYVPTPPHGVAAEPIGKDRCMAFETKDSGARQEFASGMVRDTQDGKPRWDLLIAGEMPYMQQPLTRWAALMARGAEKYGDNNWLLGAGRQELDRARSSAARHFMQWLMGETDEDHMAAVWFNMQAVEYFKWRMGGGNDASDAAAER